MSDEVKNLELMEELVKRLTDVKNSYGALIEKMAQLQLHAEQAHADTIAKRLEKPFSNASEDNVLITEILKDAELERNRIKNEAQ